jgi:hypothetical protein
MPEWDVHMPTWPDKLSSGLAYPLLSTTTTWRDPSLLPRGLGGPLLHK